MGIMDLFRGNQPSENQPQQPQQPQQPANQNSPASPQEGSVTESSNKPVDPLAAYAKIFETPKDDPTATPPSFKLDPKVVGETAAQMDFLQGINPETLQAATSGDIQALLKLVNTVGQKSYQAALSHTTHLTDQFVDARSKFDFDRNLGSRVKSELTTQHLSAAPNYANPVVKAELNKKASEFARAYPDASPQEVATMAQDYIRQMAEALNPSQKTPKQDDGEDMDWTKYLTQ